MSSPANFLRLPYLPLSEIFKHLDFMELFNLSQCSKKAAEKVKNVSTKRYKLALWLADCNSVHVYDDQDKEVANLSFETSKFIREGQIYKRRDFRSGEIIMNVPVAFPAKSELASYWDDPFIGMKAVVFHLMEVLKSPIKSVYTFDGFLIENFLAFIGNIMEKQAEINDLAIQLRDLTDNDLKRTLHTLNVTDELSITMQPGPNFEYNFERLPKIIEIWYSSWVTTEKLFSFNSCQVIDLNGSKFTNQDINIFMESWKAGKLPKLEMFSVASANLNARKKIAGIFVGRNSTDREIRQKSKCALMEVFFRIGGQKLFINAGWNIERNDGVMGTIKLDKRGFDSRNIQFQMIVWL